MNGGALSPKTGRNEWESATITLPSAAVAGFKKTLVTQANSFHASVRAEAIRMHKVAASTSAKKYAENVGRLRRESTYDDDGVVGAAFRVLERISWGASNGEGVHQPTVADVENVAPRATNRTTVFSNSNASITISGRVVQWDVPDNNHAVEHAQGSPLGRTFFAALDSITWTRGTGGTGVGNDEYASESDYVGGGGNYATFHYGPQGR